MMDNSNNNHLDQNIHKDNDDDDDEKYAFPCNVVDLELPDPPMDASPMYITTATTTGTYHTGDAMDRKEDDGNETSNDTQPPVLYKVPTRFNYVTSNTTKVIIQRDVHGNDYSTTANDNNHDDDGSTNGIGWFTNHRTIYVENGRINRYTLHANGFELIPLLQDDDDKISLRSSFPDPTTTKSLTDIDFTNRNDVLQSYYPYCQQLLQQVLLDRYGDQVQVWAFDHNVRIQPLTSPSPQQEGNEEVETEPSISQNNGTTTSTTPTTTVIQKPIGLVHGDYTTISAPRRLQLLGEPPKINDVYYEQFQMLSKNDNTSTHDDCSTNKVPQNSLLDPSLVQECLSSSSLSSPPGDNTTSPRRRYAFINVWKNIDPHHPVMALPLGCVDATTVSMDNDLRTLELHYTDRIGENYLVCRPPISESPQHERREHHWVYYPQMTHNEVLLIKQWDSSGTDITSTNKNHKEEEYISTMAIHSAFIDPTTPPNNTIRRKSIEVRCVAIWV